MAFDQRLDSDYVDLALESWLSRIPVLGSVMSLWLSRSPNGKSRDEESRDATSCTSLMEMTNDDSNNGLPELQSFASSSSSATNLQFDERDKSSSSINEEQQRRRTTQRKVLSWSDTSGQGDLCHYFASAVAAESEMDESSAGPVSVAHLPATQQGSASPSKLTRTRSGFKQFDDNACNPTANLPQQKHSYLPRMDPKSTGIVMPTQNPSASFVCGNDSPQYGFYVNLTPPSPTMYHGRHVFEKLSSGSSPASSSTVSQSPFNIRGSSGHKPVNPVFQGLLMQHQHQRTTHAVVNFPTAPL